MTGRESERETFSALRIDIWKNSELSEEMTTHLIDIEKLDDDGRWKSKSHKLCYYAEVGKVRPLGAPVLIIYYQYTPPFELRFAELFKRN